MLPAARVQQATSQPINTHRVQAGSLIYTDDAQRDIYARLPEWGYAHETVNHFQGEYARDADGDGFHEIHVNTLEGF